MDATKKQLFEIFNHFEDVNEEHFLCGRCQNWLTGQITKDTNGKYICQACSLPNKEPPDQLITTLLKNLLHPCLHKDCDFIGKNDEILAHTKHCEHAPIDCPLCDELAMDLNTCKDHFKTKHASIIQEIDYPELCLSLPQFQKNDKFIVIFKQHLFLLFLKLIDGKIAINVAKLFHNQHEDCSKTFTVSLVCGDINYEFTKSMIVHSDINNADFTANFTNLNPTKIKIFFCKFNQAIQLGECPICEHYLGVRLYQCTNGHNVCNDCGNKITSCAICRDDSLMSVNLQFLFQNILKSCENSVHGCLYIEEKSERHAHKNKCLYNSLECPICNDNVYKMLLKAHILQNHKNDFAENGSPVNYALQYERFCCIAHYRQFDSELFAVTLEHMDTDMEQVWKCGFSVRMVYCENIEEAKKYIFEIQILDKGHSGRMVHSLCGVCQTADDSNCTVIINIALLENYMSEIGDSREIYFRCLIKKA